MSITIETLERGYTRQGPWSSSYEVNVETMAVNIAVMADTISEEQPTGVTFRPVEMATAHLISVAGNGSIHGFWGTQWERLTPAARMVVEGRAMQLLKAHREGSYRGPADIHEMFDGQY